MYNVCDQNLNSWGSPFVMETAHIIPHWTFNIVAFIFWFCHTKFSFTRKLKPNTETEKKEIPQNSLSRFMYIIFFIIIRTTILAQFSGIFFFRGKELPYVISFDSWKATASWIFSGRFLPTIFDPLLCARFRMECFGFKNSRGKIARVAKRVAKRVCNSSYWKRLSTIKMLWYL